MCQTFFMTEAIKIFVLKFQNVFKKTILTIFDHEEC